MWDNYGPDSSKAQTRDTRGKWIRRRVEPNNAVPKTTVFRINENNAELFAFPSISIVTMSTDKQVICAIDNYEIVRQPRDMEGLAHCSHEEADSGMIVQVAEAANKYRSILTRGQQC